MNEPDIPEKLRELLACSEDEEELRDILSLCMSGDERSLTLAVSRCWELPELQKENFQEECYSQIIKALANLEPPIAVDLLLECWDDSDYETNWDECESQIVRCGQPAIEILIDKLAEEEPGLLQTRWDHPVYALIEFGDLALDRLIEALKDERWAVAEGAAQALGYIKNPKAIEPLRSALRANLNPNGDTSFVASAGLALVRLGDVSAVKYVVGVDWKPSNEDWVNFFLLADEAIQALGQNAVEPLIEKFREASEKGSDSSLILENMSNHGTAAIFAKILADKSEDPVLRANAADALGRFRDDAVVEPLWAALDDSGQNEKVRDAAREALKRLGHTA